MTKEQEEIIIEELEQLIEKTSFLREEEFYTLFTIHEVQNIASLLNMLKEKESEIEKYKQLYNKALDDAVITAHDNMKKDKMIDLMAEELQKHIFVLYDGDTITSKKGIIQHYEIEAIFKIKQQQILQELIGDESNE